MLENIVTVVLLGAYGLFLLLDFVVPGRRYPEVRRWRLRGAVSFVMYVALATVAPLFWDAHLAAYRLFDLTGLGTVGGALVAFLALEVGIYVWHRAMHNVDFLWRWFHQMHHSAERIDIWGAFYFSPLDVIGFAFVASLSSVWLIGVTPEAAILANGVVTFLAFFQHANIRTPAWLGYIVQRPEGHMLHHERGVHAYNYTDLALIDMLFGTWRNPRTWEGIGGFWDGASARVGAMLLGRDVSEPSGRRPQPEAPRLEAAE